MIKWPAKALISASLVFVVFTTFSLAQEMNRRIQVKREVAQLEQEVKKLNKSLVEMENLNHYFSSDAYKERMAREKLNYRAPGEEVVIVPEEGWQKNEDISSEEELSKDMPMPLRWWNAFFVDPQRDNFEKLEI